MSTISLALRPALLGLAALLAAPRGDELMKPADQKKLGKLVADYFEAKDKSSGIDKAYQEIADTVDKLEKKLEGQSALAYVEDWEQVFFQARSESLADDLKIRKGKPHETSASLPNGSADFAVAVPGSYNPRKGPVPLVIVVADAEGKSALELLESEWATGDLAENGILLAPKMPADRASWGEINGAGGPGGVSIVMGLYGQFLRQFPIDMDRVYLVGYGHGAAAVGRVAGMYPHLFAGLVLLEPAEIDPTNFKSLPSLVVGTKDGATGLAKRVGELGYDNATARPATTAVDAWTWCKEHARDPYPGAIVFAPLTPYTTSAHWISLSGADVEGGARISARSDAATNAIVIEAEKVTGVRLYFNDRLVDLNKPVKVVINDVTKSWNVERNKRLMLDLNYQNGDWGRVFTNRLDFDVPAPESK